MLPESKAPSVKSHFKSTDNKWARMGYWLFPLLIIHFSLLTLQCGLDVEDPNLPSPPQWIEKSLPEEWPERGIDAHETGSIQLEWEVESIDNIVAFQILRSQVEVNSIENLTEGSKTRIEVRYLNEYSFLQGSIETNIQYSYRILAEDNSGNLSTYSEPANYTRLPKVLIDTMNPNGQFERLGSDRTLLWEYEISLQVGNYCITILDSTQGLVLRQLSSPHDYSAGYEYFQIPYNVVLDDKAKYLWRVDVGADYVDGCETAGSESSWAAFRYYIEE